MKAPNAGFGRVAGIWHAGVFQQMSGCLVFPILLLSDLGSSQSPPADVTKHLDLARQYLDQESYRNAIVGLQTATAIYPNIGGRCLSTGIRSIQNRQLT